MEVTLFDLNNNEKGKINIADEIFNSKVNDYLIWLAITVEEANKRVGSANTKTKAEVSGSGRKPWRQKGTGRARVGYRRNPIWRGGGVVFGPKPRSYNKKINKKMKQRAYISLFSLKFKKGQIKFIEDIRLDEPKTKKMKQILENLKTDSSVLLIYGDKEFVKNGKGEEVLSISENDRKIKLASKNIPYLKTLHWNILNCKDIFYKKNILITESALKNIEEKYLKLIK
jgi:large subunit ribosomal protein L4